ncbi:hypothetical protein R2R35_19785 [Anaerocolumna sp. AGMB13020]|nr:5'-nucleotidase C-terminal domain-containing protein [Anaerocolumna sp. AGMB13020]WOO36014.1 hypothetical protein R2R35_19785 [Anaerocolumna sp. AGMB13020]
MKRTWGDFVTDAFRDATGADIVITNGGGNINAINQSGNNIFLV